VWGFHVSKVRAMSRDNWTNERMRKLLADNFCPKCTKHRMLHDNEKCSMRFIKEEETCVSSALLNAPVELWLP